MNSSSRIVSGGDGTVAGAAGRGSRLSASQLPFVEAESGLFQSSEHPFQGPVVTFFIQTTHHDIVKKDDHPRDVSEQRFHGTLKDCHR